MAKLKKIAEIKAYYGCEAKEVVETLENKGFLVVDDDENDTVNKIWHVLKNVENGWNQSSFGNFWTYLSHSAMGIPVNKRIN